MKLGRGTKDVRFTLRLEESSSCGARGGADLPSGGHGFCFDRLQLRASAGNGSDRSAYDLLRRVGGGTCRQVYLVLYRCIQNAGYVNDVENFLVAL